MTRAFYCQWLSSGGPRDIEDGYFRASENAFIVSMFYSTDYKWDVLNEMVTKDRNDMLKTLRSEASWSGYNDANPSAEIGLMDRLYTGTSLDVEPGFPTATLRLDFNCTVKELEY